MTTTAWLLQLSFLVLLVNAMPLQVVQTAVFDLPQLRLHLGWHFCCAVVALMTLVRRQIDPLQH